MCPGIGGGPSTFDNNTTYTHIGYLARVRRQTGLTCYDEGIQKGIQYTLDTQNQTSGGWRGADVDAVTFNDGVMANVMTFLAEVVTDRTLYGWLDEATQSRAKTAYDKGLACILACQVRQGETLTAWGQQHDHRTLKPCWARDYEPPCIASCESVGVVRHLMKIENPSTGVIRSIQAAITWFEAVNLDAARVVVPDMKSKNTKHRPVDVLIVKDLDALAALPVKSFQGPPIWARMYDPDTNEVLLYDRGKKRLEKFTDMSAERRLGYTWQGTWPKTLLEEDYPKWQKKWAPGKKQI